MLETYLPAKQKLQKTLRLLRRKSVKKLNVDDLFPIWYLPVMAKSMGSRDRVKL